MASTPPTETAPRTGSLALALALAPRTLVAGIAGGIAFPILPIAGVRMGLSIPFIGVILAANRAMRIVSSPTIGIAADRFGGRKTLLIGLSLQIVVMALYAIGIVTRHPGIFFLAGRLVHGPASAGVFVSAQALALQAGGPARGGGTVGMVRAAIVLGIPVGLVIGGLLSEAVGEARTFGISAAGMAVALAAAWLMVPDLRVDAKTRPPLLATLRAMRDSRLLAVGSLNFALNFAAGGMVLTTVALLVRERHLTLLGRNDQGTSGILMGVMTIVDVLATPLAGILGDKLRAHARIAAVSLGLLVPGLALVGLSAHVPGILAGIVVMGLGAAGLGPALLVIMGSIVPHERRGTGAGLLQLCGDVGGMLGPLVGTALFAGDTALPYLGTAGLMACFLVPALWLARIETRATATEAR